MTKRLLTVRAAAGRALARPLVASALLVGTLGLAGCGSSSDPAPPEAMAPAAASADADVVELDAAAQRQIRLLVEPAAMRPMAETIRTTAVVGPDETRLARVRPLGQGLVQRVLVRHGDRVRAGQVLLEYDNVELGDLVAEYRTAAAGLNRAAAEADVTARARERGEELAALGAIARSDEERRRAEDAAALAALDAERARLASVAQKLRRFGLDDEDLARAARGDEVSPHTELRAPFAGVVIATSVAEGELVTPERELLTIANLSTVWVQGDLYQQNVGAVAVGQVARVFVSAYPGEVFEGRITYIGDVLDPATRAAHVRSEVANPDGRLKLEMAATLEIPAAGPRQALMVPAAAVQRVGGQSAVFVRSSDTTFVKRTVRTGVERDGWIEIVAGVSEGEAVATEGAVMLKSKLMIGELGEHERP